MACRAIRPGMVAKAAVIVALVGAAIISRPGFRPSAPQELATAWSSGETTTTSNAGVPHYRPSRLLWDAAAFAGGAL